MSAMKNCRQRIEAIEKWTGTTALVSTFILAVDHEGADKQVRQFEALRPDCRMTLFVMIGSTTYLPRIYEARAWAPLTDPSRQQPVDWSHIGTTCAKMAPVDRYARTQS